MHDGETQCEKERQSDTCYRIDIFILHFANTNLLSRSVRPLLGVSPNAIEQTYPLLTHQVNVNKSVIAMAKGPRYLAALLGHPPITKATLECICVVCKDHVECRDAFPPQGMIVIAKILQSAADMSSLVRTF